MLSPNEIQQKVLERIHSGKVGMRSRAYFVIRTLAIGIGAALALFISLFVLSFVFFSLRESGVHFLLAFGSPGLALFVALFPWTLLAFSASILIALEIILRHTTTAYRFSALRLFGGMLGGTVLLSLLLLFTPLHSMLLSAADRDQLPFLRSWYEQVHMPHTEHGIFRGYITSISSSTFIISYNESDRDSDEGTWVIIPPSAFNLQSLTVGEKVFIAGHPEASTTIRAFGVRVVPPDRPE